MSDKKYIVIVADKKKGDEHMSPKTGRPKSDKPKSNRVTVRLDDETFNKLQSYCDKKSIDKAEAIRRGISKLVDK